MKTGGIFPIKIPFSIPVGPDKRVERFVYSYVIDGDSLCLIDSGVAGAEKVISAALQEIGKNLADIDTLVLTHSHPDHIGAATVIQKASGAQVWAHPNERAWIEDTERQGRERPVPGFADLVSGPVKIDRLLSDGEALSFGSQNTYKVLHTPGHSSGSISLFCEETGILFCGDVIPQPGGMPIYEDVAALAESLVRLAKINNLTALYSSWADPLHGRDAVNAIHAGMRFLKTIHDVVAKVDLEYQNPDPMELCRQCIPMLGLPPFAANPLVARSLLAHREISAREGLDLLAPFG